MRQVGTELHVLCLSSERKEKDRAIREAHEKRLLLEFCILCQRLRPFHKGLEDFSSVRIQSGVAENPLLPSRVT